MLNETARDQWGKVGLGTFPFSGVFTPLDQGIAQQIVQEFLELGGRYIETAPSYPIRGVDLGAILRSFKRSDFTLATKCVTALGADGSRIRSGNYQFVVGQVHRELERLGLDYLDLVQAHITPMDTHPSETMRALTYLREQKLARHIGVSNVTLKQLREFEEGGEVEFIQIRLSMIHRSEYEALAAYCLEHNIKFNPYQVIERGQLTNFDRLSSSLRDGDLRRSKTEYVGEANALVREWVERTLRPLAESLGCTVESLSIAWALRQPGVVLCVVGATAPEQVRSNLAATTLNLSESSKQAIEEAYRTLEDTVREKCACTVDQLRGLA